jgi:hypothetical protein
MALETQKATHTLRASQWVGRGGGARGGRSIAAASDSLRESSLNIGGGEL